MDIKDVEKLITDKKNNVLVPMVQSMAENFAKCFETGVEVGIEIGKAIGPEWHKPSEEPDEGKEVFYECDTACGISHEVGFYHKDKKNFSKDQKHQRFMSEVAKWAYVEDLIAV